jgi:hypothetical protein
MGTKRKAQALIELAVGMFAFALVITALFTFTLWIAKSLKMQNSLRTSISTQTDTIRLTTFGAEYLFGTETIKIKESVKMPGMEIIRPQ